ncbi:flavodoxin [Lactiplantibacillus paraplantarum]|uniref:flavodoxin n=1 Tax=Lactiplantibacillus paraplantarum TaxID=60520 RepID=UPI003B27C6C9
MKKWLIGALVIIVLVVVGFVLWGRQGASQSKSTTANSSVKQSVVPTKKMLIVYYSNSGTTEKAAKTIQKQTGADMVKLRLSPNYPSDYSKLTVIAKRQIDQKIHPEILNKIDIAKYSTILLGFPTWYQRPPMFINTFFEKYNLTGKTIIPFTTSMSSSVAVSRPYLKKMIANKKITLQKGFRANNTENITTYLKQHHLEK